MFNKNKPRSDVFTFSLKGMMAVGGYVGVPAIAARSLGEVDKKPSKRSTKPEELLGDCSASPVNQAHSARQHSNAA